jgi:uncharacterized membrane protein YsdA (DUF1294 family)
MPRRPSSDSATAPSIDGASAGALVAFGLAYALVALVRGTPGWVDALYLGASVVCVVVYGIDKFAARRGGDRVPEAMLLSLGAIGGWPGAIVAQQLFRHKTVKCSFRVRFWLTVALNVAGFAWATIATRSVS